MSDIKTITRDIGGVLSAVGFISLLVLIVPLYFGEYSNPINGFVPILITSAIFIGFGLPLFFIFRNAEPATFKTAMITAALGWLFVSLIGSIPFILMPYNKLTIETMDFLSAFFESMSGWTGTGLTMVEKEDLLPYTLQFWRTWSQWVGSVGVIVLTLTILARPGTGSYILYRGEARDQKTHPSIVSTVRAIWKIFLLYTVIGIIAVYLVGILTKNGMSPWQAINHAMTSLATGGFSVTDDSLVSFGAPTQVVILILMILGATSFAAHYYLLSGKFRKFFSDAQLKAMIALIILGVVVLLFLNFKFFEENLLLSLKASGFQFISALTTTGFSSVENLAIWPDASKLILAFAMIVGGAAGSTAGGIKLYRAILLYKGVDWRIKRAISTPRRVFVHKLGDKSLSKEDAMDLINEAAIISFMWVILLFIGVVVIIESTGSSLSNAIFEVCSAQGNVGLSTGITSIHMSTISKTMLIINMWVGRLEIIPIIVLIKSIFGLKRNIL